MAEPERIYDNDLSEEPVTRPDLKALEGGGQTTPAKTGHLKAVSPDDLQNAESTGATHEGSAGSEKEKKAFGDQGNQIGERGYNSDDQNSLGKFRSKLTRKKVIGGGAIGLIIAVIFGGLTFFSGPLQFIHIAQLLQKFHFASQEDAGDDRMVKIFRYIRYRGSEKTRLNLLGNAYADKIEAKLNRSGIQSAYTEKLRYFDGYVIDPATAKEGTQFHGQTAEQIGNDLVEKGKIPAEALDFKTKPGSVLIHTDGLDLGFRKEKGLVKEMLRASGYSKIGAALRARLLGKRALITWHPIKKLDKKLLKNVSERYAKWSKDRGDRLKNGAHDEPNFHAQEEDDGKGHKTTDPIDEEVAKGAEEVTHVEGDAPSKLAKIASHPAFQASAGATAIVGVMCAVRAIAANIDDVKQANVVLPLMRIGMEAVTVGNQVMTGKDVDTEQLGFYAKQLSSEKNGSWANARSIQAEEGKEQTGPDIRPEAKIKNEENAVSTFINSFPSIGPVCDAAGSIIGQIVTSAIDVIIGPLSAAGGFLFSKFVAPDVLDGVIHWLAGEQIDVNVAGADYGNYINYGARLAANDSYIAAGGRELSSVEIAQLKSSQNRQEQQEEKTKSFADRIFNPYDAHSLISKVIDQQDPNLGTNIASAVGKFANIGHILSSLPKMFATITTHKAQAVTTYNYGFPLYGFSVAEMNNPATRNPFSNADKVGKLLKTARGKIYIERTKNCFAIDLDEGGNVKNNGKSIAYNKIPKYCSGDKSLSWLRIRHYIHDTQLMESTACFEGGDDSCDNVGFSLGSKEETSGGGVESGAVGNIGESSDGVPCASGTKDLGVVVSRYTGSYKKTPGPLKIRLCQVAEIPGTGNDTSGRNISGGAVVNSRVSGAWLGLAKEAAARKVGLSASSSFRLADSCRGTGTGSRCAKPGQSPHQLGIAIDFNNMSKTGSSTLSCSGRARLPGNPRWDWLFKNAERWGIRQYTYEAWHWDLLPANNRCNSKQ